MNLLTNIFGNLGLESFSKGFSFSRQPSGVEKDHFKFNQPKTNPDFTKRKSQNENNFLQKRLKNVASDVDCVKNDKHMNQIYTDNWLFEQKGTKQLRKSTYRKEA